ncbi:MAG: hypothetical protein RJA22_3112, partial [Verrucomicrobiota bacterium]
MNHHPLAARCLLALSLLAAAGSLPAADDTWNKTSGTNSWDAPANWVSGAQFPNGVSDVANVNINLSAASTINLNQPITVGTLNLGDSTTAYYALTLNAGTAGTLTFDSFTGTALMARTVTVSPGVTDTLNVPVAIYAPLNVSFPWVNAANGIRLNGLVSGFYGIQVQSPSMPSPNTTMAQFLDLVNTGNTFPGNLEVANGVV